MAEFKAGYALCMGIGAYQHLRKLRKAPNDAQDLAALLVQQCGYPPAQVSALIDAEATREAMTDKLAWLAQQATQDSTVVIFFSGHGVQIFDKAASGDYLCPVNADLSDVQKTLFSSADFSAALHKIKAQKVVVLFDACHSGGVGEIKDATIQVKDGLSPQQYERLAEGEGRVIIASCKADESSLELHAMRNSLFSHYVLEGLRGAAADAAGEVNIFDLFRYVEKHVLARIENIRQTDLPDAAQTPWLTGKTGSFVVAIAPQTPDTNTPTLSEEEAHLGVGIPTPLLNRLRDTLVRCPCLQSHAALRAVFDDARLAMWAREVPEVKDVQGRVDQMITFLRDRQTIKDEDGLALFLRVAAERLPQQDKLRRELKALSHALASQSNVSVLDYKPPVETQKAEDESEMKDYEKTIPASSMDWSQYADSLLEILKQIQALGDFGNRSSLLKNLPPGPSGYIKRSMAKNADLRNIVNDTKGMGRLTTGEYALVVVARNALDFVAGVEIESRLQALINAVR